MLQIRSLRIEKEKTQEEVARILGISRQVYANYENNINEPSLSMLAQLADFFECSTDYLLGREDDFGNVNVPMQRFDLTQEETELLEDYRSLSPALQEMLRATIETWKGTKANVSKKHNVRKN